MIPENKNSIKNYVPDTEIPIIAAVSCFHCDAANMTHCEQIGEEKPCLADVPMACMVEVRKRKGKIEGVSWILSRKLYQIHKLFNSHAAGWSLSRTNIVKSILW